MSSQRGNVKKSGPPKHQNKRAWKNVYHDTSHQTKKIIETEVSGVCRRCKDVIDWKIKYKKYKPLTQPKTCVICKQKRVKFAYHTYCASCSQTANKCAKCGENKEIVIEPSRSEGEKASEERQFQFELDMLPERKRRTYLRLQAQGKLTPDMALDKMDLEMLEDDDTDDDSDLNDDKNDTEQVDTPELVKNKTRSEDAASKTREAGMDTHVVKADCEPESTEGTNSRKGRGDDVTDCGKVRIDSAVCGQLESCRDGSHEDDVSEPQNLALSNVQINDD